VHARLALPCSSGPPLPTAPGMVFPLGNFFPFFSRIFDFNRYPNAFSRLFFSLSRRYRFGTWLFQHQIRTFKKQLYLILRVIFFFPTSFLSFPAFPSATAGPAFYSIERLSVMFAPGHLSVAFPFDFVTTLGPAHAVVASFPEQKGRGLRTFCRRPPVRCTLILRPPFFE